MATGTASNHFKYNLVTKAIHLGTDNIKVCLMKSGFVFDQDDHAKLINIRTNSAAQNLTAATVDDSITGDAGDFVTAGFVPGNIITTDMAINSGPFTIVTVTATKITVAENLTDEGPSAAKTVSSDDELETANGYTQFTEALAGQALTEDDSNNRAEMTCNTISWTATGGDIGPTPGALLIDDTATNDPIIGYIDFGAEMTAAAGADFEIANLKIRLS